MCVKVLNAYQEARCLREGESYGTKVLHDRKAMLHQIAEAERARVGNRRSPPPGPKASSSAAAVSARAPTDKGSSKSSGARISAPAYRDIQQSSSSGSGVAASAPAPTRQHPKTGPWENMTGSTGSAWRQFTDANADKDLDDNVKLMQMEARKDRD